MYEVPYKVCARAACKRQHHRTSDFCSDYCGWAVANPPQTCKSCGGVLPPSNDKRLRCFRNSCVKAREERRAYTHKYPKRRMKRRGKDRLHSACVKCGGSLNGMKRSARFCSNSCKVMYLRKQRKGAA